MRASTHTIRRSVLLASLVVFGLLILIGGTTFAEGEAGLQNPSFETGDFTGWEIASQSVEGAVSVLQLDDESTYPIFGTVGTTVEPLYGEWMARFGMPKDKDSHQAKGVCQVEQTFMSDGRNVWFAFRIFTWEHRDSDAFVIDVRQTGLDEDGDGVDDSVGNLTDLTFMERLQLFVDGVLSDFAPLPYGFSFYVEPKEKYQDTDWVDALITDLPGSPEEPVELTISFTLDTDTDAAHDTWVYLDLADDNVAPVIEITSPLDGSATSEPRPQITFTVTDDSPLAGVPQVELDNTPLGEEDISWDEDTGQGSATPVDDLEPGSHTVTVTARDIIGNESSAISTFTIGEQGEPQAVIHVLPRVQVEDGVQTGFPPQEGDIVGIYGFDSTDSYGGDQITEYKWEFWQGDDMEAGDPLVSTAPEAVFFLLPDEGPYTVKLTVTDAYEQTASAIETINADGFQPRVKALDVDVLEGQPAGLFGRFLDTGWRDIHEVTWSVDGYDLMTDTSEQDEGRLPAVSSGFASAQAIATGGSASSAGTFSVTDNEGLAGICDFTVTAIADDPNRHELVNEGDLDDDLIDEATSVKADSANLSWIQESGDIDFYKLTTTDNGPLPYGTQVLVSLKDLPADFDVAVFQDYAGADAPEAAAQDISFNGSSSPSASVLDSRWLYGSPLDSRWLYGSPLFDARWLYGSPIDARWLYGSPFDSRWLYGSSLFDARWLYGSPIDTRWLYGSPFDSRWLYGSGGPFIPNEPDMWVGYSPLDSRWLYGSPFDRGWAGLSPLDYMDYLHTLPDGSAQNQLDGFPLTDLEFTDLVTDKADGTDLVFEELGFDHNELFADRPGMRVVGFSANRGLENDTVLISVQAQNASTYIGVVGANGANSTKPYRLEVETSTPLSIECEGTELAGTGTEYGSDPSGSTTLFVTQKDRLEALYGVEGWALVEAALVDACADPLVQGEILSIPAELYTDFDTKPSRVDLANQLAYEIRELIQDRLLADASIEYVVIVGSDKIVPFRRVVDITSVGNERYYRDDAGLIPSSQLFASLNASNYLTDDYYVDEIPLAYNGASLYIPDVSISRLVETPEDIDTVIRTFLAADDGELVGATTLVAGYDFMMDGATRVEDVLEAAGIPTVNEGESLIRDDWGGDDLRAQLVKDPKVVDLAGHFVHFAGISAYGHLQGLADAEWGPEELLLSNELAETYSPLVTFSMGCHAGLNVPDTDVVTAGLDPAPTLDQALDFAQAVLSRGGVFMGNTGFGYGESEAIGQTEALLVCLAEHLVTGESLGQALKGAKEDFVGSLGNVTPYDQKAAGEFVLYGMPQYHLSGVAGAPESTTESGALSSATAWAASLIEAVLAAIDQSLTLTVTDADGSTLDQPYGPDYTLRVVTSSSGLYYSAEGVGQPGSSDVQATPGRPVQPRIVLDIPALVGYGPVTGAIITNAENGVIADFDPAITDVVTEFGGAVAEPQSSSEGWWPAVPVTVTSIDTPDGIQQRLVIIPGQFRPTSTDPVVTGDERLWTSLNVELVRAPVGSTDHEAPTVNSVSLMLSDDTLGDTTLSVTVDASDASGIARIDVEPTKGDLAHTFLEPVPGNSPYTVELGANGVAPEDVEVTVKVWDNAYNMTQYTAKGAGVTVGPPVITTVTPGEGLDDGGNIVIIEGLNLYGVTDVTFGGASASIVLATPTSIAVEAPAYPGVSELVEVMVTTPVGISEPAEYLYVLAAPPIGAATHLQIEAPTWLAAGAPFSVTVTAQESEGGATVTDYLGTVHFETTDPTATLPADYTFTVADAGVHTFTDELTLGTLGEVVIVASDTVSPYVSGSASVNVTDSTPVSFPDPNLETAVRAALAIPTADIMPEDMELLTELWADDSGITDLHGLEYAVNVQTLHLDQNAIIDISPLADLADLYTLSLAGNGLADISPLTGLTQLDQLVLADNAITDFSPLAGLTNLYTLSLSNTGISDISPLADMTEVVNLSLDHNAITDISYLDDVTAVVNLYLEYNAVNDISALVGLTQLAHLYLSNNIITDIQPLLDNSGLGTGDTVWLQDNYLDLAPGSDDMADIAELLSQVTTVIYEPQKDLPTAVPDTYITIEETSLSVAAPGVLSNDTDPIGDGLTAELATDVSDGTLTLNADGSFTYDPDEDFSGEDSFTYSAAIYDGAVDSVPATVTITVDPVNDAPSFTKGADQTVNEDAGPQTVPGWATAISPGGGADESTQALEFNLVDGANALFAVQPAIDASTGDLTYTPAVDANGSVTVTFTLSDDGGTANGGIDTSSEQTFTITVTPVNDAPSFTKGGDPTVYEDAGPVTVPGWATAISTGPSDESGQVLAFALTNDNNDLFLVQPAIDATTGDLSFTPAPDANGGATVTVSLSDDGGTANGGADTSPEQTFIITVITVNDAPSFTKGADQTVTEDSGEQTVPGWATAISPGPSDESGQTMAFALTNDNNDLFQGPMTIDADSGDLTYWPAPDANGSATVTVSLSDDGGTANGGADTSPEQTFIITVTPVNDAPTFTKGGDPTPYEDAGTLTYAGWAADISPGPSDESGQVLAFALTNDNNDLFSTQPTLDVSTGALSFESAPDANGSATVTVTLSDDGGTANGGVDSSTQTFTITVTPVNDAPSFTKGADQTTEENDGVALTVPGWAADISPGPSDESGQILAFALTNDNNGLFSVQPAVDATTGDLTYTPAPYTTGTAAVTIALSDDGGTANGGVDTSPPQTFTITVEAANVAPSISVPPTLPGGAEPFTLDYTDGSFTDPDPDSWTGQVDYDDGGGFEPLTLAGDKSFDLYHVYALEGHYTITVEISDGTVASAETMELDVSNAAPAVDVGTDQTAVVDTAITLSGDYLDTVVESSYTYVWDFGDTTSESGSAGAGTGGTIEASPHAYTAAGTYTATLTVTDSDGGSGSDSLDVTVTEAAPATVPIITTVAGDGTAGYADDSSGTVLATTAPLNSPHGVVTDADGNLYIADSNNHRVRRVDADTGFITTVAGTGIGGYYEGDAGVATTAWISSPGGVAMDNAGNLFIADTGNHVVRMVDTSGIISVVAGIPYEGSFFEPGTPILATATYLNGPNDVAVDAEGNLYIADTLNNRIRKVDTSGYITTVAGDGSAAYGGDGALATSAQINHPLGVAVDDEGNILIADYYNNRIRMVNGTTGIITTVAGTGTSGHTGDDGAATAATLSLPAGIEVDAWGNLFIADQSNNCIRMVDGATGIITTVAGDGTPAYGGDGNAATEASIDSPADVAVDTDGNVYIADRDNNRIRKVASVAVITTVAGNGWVATDTYLNYPLGVAVDTAGNIFIADNWNERIRKVDVNGIMSTVAGNGTAGYSGDGVAATGASLNDPHGVAVDAAGNFFIADRDNNRIRMVEVSTGDITTVAGNGTQAYSGDGDLAVDASLNNPSDVEVDAAGNLFIADRGNNRIRMVEASTGDITTVAGNGSPGYSGDGSSATAASLNGPIDVAVDTAGNIFIADELNNCVRMVEASTGDITTVAGNGTAGYSGDGDLATAASFDHLKGVAVDAAGNIFIADEFNCRVRMVNEATGIITTVAGNGTADHSGDGGLATDASLDNPYDVAVDAGGDIFIADYGNHCIRRVNGVGGTITTVAGNGIPDYVGDGRAATSALLNIPGDAAVDTAGNLFIADTLNNRIRKVDTSGIITAVAGNGTAGYSGDGGPATSASLGCPDGVAVDAAGNLFIADTLNHRVRKVDTSGIITTVAGNGTADYSGDGGIATDASLRVPVGVAVDAAGNVFIADKDNHRVRMVDTSGIITTVAGNGTADYGGDGGLATSASLNEPSEVAVDAAGNLFIADYGNHRIRRVNGVGGTIVTVAGNGIAGYGGDEGQATSASLNYPIGVAVDTAGNLLVADMSNHRIRQVYPSTGDPSVGYITTVAGNGFEGYGGDNGPATSATLQYPGAVAVDAMGNIFIVDTHNNRVRKVVFMP